MTSEACPICGAEATSSNDLQTMWPCGRWVRHKTNSFAAAGMVCNCSDVTEAEVLRLRAEVEQWKTVSAAGVRPDIHAWMVRDRDRLRAQLDGVVAAVEGANRYRPVVMSARGAMISVEDGAWIKRDAVIARIKGGGE